MTGKAADKKSRFMEWIDQRYPWTDFWKKHLSEYYAPRNFNFWYFFGSFSLLVFVFLDINSIGVIGTHMMQGNQMHKDQNSQQQGNGNHV